MKPLDTAFAARMEAMRLSRNAVRDQLRAEGVKLSYMKASEIDALARIWFGLNRAELFGEALRTVLARTLQHPARNRRVPQRQGENAQ